MGKSSLFRGGGIVQPFIVPFGNEIFLSENVMAKEMGGIVYVSTDYGVTYPKSINVSSQISKIDFVHVFSNGTLLIAGHKNIYYTSDYISLTPCNVTDINGNTFVPILNYNNYSPTHQTYKNIHGGQEVLIWGNYNNVENPNPATNAKAYVWFTDDFGKNIRMIWQSGVTPTINNGILSCRHVHGVDYNEDGGYWILTTGDEPREINSHWIKITKSGANFTFDWIGSGDRYKVCNIIFDGEYAYSSLDMSNGGLQRVKIAEMRDPTKFEGMKLGLNDAIYIAVKNNQGLIFTSRWFGQRDGRLIHYSPNISGGDWREILGDMPEGYDERSVFNRVSKPNSRGHILSGIIMDYRTPSSLFPFTPSVFINDILKKNGFPDAFK